MHVLAVAGTGDDGDLRIQAAHGFGGTQGDVRVTAGDDEELRLLDLRGPQNFRAQGVTVVDRHLGADAARHLDTVYRSVQGNVGHALGPEHTGDDLPHAAHAGDDDARAVAIDLLILLGHLARRGLLLGQQRCEQQNQERRNGHRQGDRQYQQVVLGGAQQLMSAGQLKDHKGELAAGGQHHAQAQCAAAIKPGGQATGQVDQRQLEYNDQCSQQRDGKAVGLQQRYVGLHAHGDKEQPQQQPLEGLDLRLQLMPVFRVGQQQAGQKGAKGHGYTHRLHQPCRADHHQQGGGGGYFLQAGAGHYPEHRAQQITAADNDHGDTAKHLDGLQQQVAVTAAVRLHAE